MAQIAQNELHEEIEGLLYVSEINKLASEL